MLANMGANNIGESYVEEFEKKYLQTRDLNINWHFIGHLHRKRTQKVVGRANYIHGVDSLRLAKKIDRTATTKNIVQKILIQVNTSKESTKYGFGVEEILDWNLWEALVELKHVGVVGLMTMAPFTDNSATIRACFRKLKGIRDELQNGPGIELPELSMGMTNDYGLAIEEGATMIRIGTAIMGSRENVNFKNPV